jgi:hypothetical protein
MKKATVPEIITTAAKMMEIMVLFIYGLLLDGV